MSKTYKTGKRRRDDLELFILALVSRRVSTPYDLKEAGLSPGATIPALGRLGGAGFLLKGKETGRGRSEYKVTAAGIKRLESSWRALLETPPSEFDAILRTASLALLMGERTKVVADFLSAAACRRAPHKGSSGPLKLSKPRTPGFFALTKELSEPAKGSAEAAILRKVATFLKKSRD